MPPTLSDYSNKLAADVDHRAPCTPEKQANIALPLEALNSALSLV